MCCVQLHTVLVCLHFSFIRRLCDCYENIAFGFDANPFARARLEDLIKENVGPATRDCSRAEQVVLSGLWAWQHLPPALLRWAWVSRGLMTKEEMALASGVDGETDPDEVQKAYHGYILLDKEDTREVSETTEPVVTAEMPMARVWMMGDALEDSQTWSRLPSWIAPTLERAITSYHGNAEKLKNNLRKALATGKAKRIELQEKVLDDFTAKAIVDIVVNPTTFQAIL